MRVLLFSMILYLAGIVVVLFFRPTVMFHRDGRWKEFDLQSEDGTMFPVWLFCIVWAVISYFLVGLVISDEEPVNLATAGAAAAALTSAPFTPTARVASVAPEPEEEAVEPLPINRRRNSKKNGVGSNLSGASGAAISGAASSGAASSGAVSGPDLKPGYYKLNVAASQRNGMPRYIYVGEDVDASESD